MRNLEEGIKIEGRRIFNAINSSKEGFFDTRQWLGRAMEWVMKDEDFKVDLFRLVDVLPMLQDKDQVARHVEEYLKKDRREQPLLLNTALKAASFSWTKGLAASVIKKNVTDMARRFIAGHNIDDAKPVLRSLSEQGFFCTIDLLGEKTLSEREADSYAAGYQDLINKLPHALGDRNSANISIKASALSCHLGEEAVEYSVSDLKKRVFPLLRSAQQKKVFINFDVESFETHEIVYDLFKEVCLADDFKSWPGIGIVVQAYLREAREHLNQLLELARYRKTPLTVRLVKGAYWDYEVVRASQLGREPKVFLQKAETDICYEQLSRSLLDNADVLVPAFASHNIRSLAHAISYAKHKNIPSDRYEIQMLYGMAPALERALKSLGSEVRIYVPIGELIPGMSYLVRRLLENTSQMGFLRLSHHEQRDMEELLKPPTVMTKTPKKPNEYENIGFLDFTKREVRNDLSVAIDRVIRSLPLEIPIVIDGREEKNGEMMTRRCPSDFSISVSKAALADGSHVEAAVKICVGSEREMRTLPLEERMAQLNRLAEILDADRIAISALIAIEVGKGWAESDADVAEAIDFCRYYAHRAPLEMSTRRMGEMEGEHNVLSYQARGTTVVIAPWNFPIAILCGMSVAAYVAGNPIIMKPAEQSMAVAHALYQRMIRAGFLRQAVQFLPGVGERIGPLLVGHRDVANICFTGSMKVGHEIGKAANTVVEGQRQMKRLICEMGGKNAIIVDDDADLDEAISAIMKSAFGYAGQKCSAASRLITVGGIADPLIRRLIEATESLVMGSSLDPAAIMGPVIDEEAFRRLQKVKLDILADQNATVLYAGNEMEGGYFVAPMLVRVADPDHWLMQQELFGPILTIYFAKDVTEAIDVANRSVYALTGAFFSRSPKNIAHARENFEVGNLYINQKCTGALVYRQPFGGFKMSGTGIKAGGPNYLLNFVDVKSVSENTMRRGFAPDVDQR